MKLNRLLSLAVLAALLITACGGAASAATSSNATALPPAASNGAVTSQGRLYPKQFADISFNTGGKVAEVIAQEGDVVQANDLIARLESTDAEET